MSMTCLPAAHRLGHSDLLRCMAWDLSSVSKEPTCASMSSCEARQMGGFGCVEHLAEEHLASVQCSVFEWLAQDTALQCENPRLQPGLVKTLPETDGRCCP